MTSSLNSLTLLAFSAALLTACTSTSPSPLADRPGQTAPRFDLIATVPLAAGDTQASVEAQTHGTVLAWDTDGCDSSDAESCQALVGLNSDSSLATLSLSLSAQSLGERLGRPVAVEANRDVVSGGGTLSASMGGSRVVWAGGSLLAWSGGSRVVWAGGSFAPVPQNTQTWNTIHLQEAQTLAPNLGAGVTVAVIDTGLDLQHVAFQGALSDPSSWKDFVGGDAIPQDEGTLGIGGFGHGTNVAGIVLQVAPQAKIMPIRVLGSDGSGDVVNIAQAINWATAHGANIINLSLGTSKDSKVIQEAVKAAAARNVLVVSSAGNENEDKITYPAASSTKVVGLLSVGSVNAQDVKSVFSNYARELELTAPGENVYAPAPGNLMTAWSGTSMAAPMATGGLALALSQPLAVPTSTLQERLSASAFNVYSNPLNKAYADKLGSGRLDLLAFLKLVVR
jgi:thermitase